MSCLLPRSQDCHPLNYRLLNIKWSTTVLRRPNVSSVVHYHEAFKKYVKSLGIAKFFPLNVLSKQDFFFNPCYTLFPFSLISLCNSISSGHKKSIWTLKPHLKCLNLFALDNKTANQGDFFSCFIWDFYGTVPLTFDSQKVPKYSVSSTLI